MRYGKDSARKAGSRHFCSSDVRQPARLRGACIEALEGRLLLSDTTPPTAALGSTPPLTAVGTSYYNFHVTYTDNVAVDRSTIDAQDFIITAPDGSILTRNSAFVASGANTPSVTASYNVTAPNNKPWVASDDGTYTISLAAHQVADTNGNFVPAQKLGTFTVNINPNAGAIEGTLTNFAFGQDQPGTPPLSNWTVYLDLNHNGKLDSGEPTAVTDTTGHYQFNPIAAGTYDVRDVLPTGTFPNGDPSIIWRNITPASGVSTVTVNPGQVVGGINFDLTQIGAITGTVFQDTNGNGVQDPGEPGLSGWTVFVDLFNDGHPDSRTSPTAVTDANGHYTIDSRGQFTAYVREVVHDGYAQTSPPNGEEPVTIFQDVLVAGVNFGNKPVAPAPPAAPTAIKAEAERGTQVLVSWTDASNTETGFVIQRATRPDFSDATQVGSVLADINFFHDSSLRPGTTYYYRVQSTNGAGASSFDAAAPVTTPTDGVLIVDNTDPGGFLPTFFAPATATPGYFGPDYLQAPANQKFGEAGLGASISTSGLYDIQVRWTSGSDRADNVEFEVFDSNNHVHFFTVNEKVNGGQWNDLGTFEFDATHPPGVSVFAGGHLNNMPADGVVTIDAARFVPVPSQAIIVDNRAATVSGTWSASSNVPGFFGPDYLYGYNDGSSANVVTFTPQLPSAGFYSVYARWSAFSNRATNTQFTVQAGDGSHTVLENQQINGGEWVLLGTFPLNASADSVSVSTQGANGVVVADAVQLVPASPPNNIVVDDPQATLAGAWQSSTFVPGFVGSDYLQDGNTGKGSKSVTFTPNLPTAGTYNVFARWTSDTNRATNVPFDILHQGTLTTVTEDEQVNGGQWVLLGTFSFDAGTGGSVKIRNDATNGFVIADAVMFSPA